MAGNMHQNHHEGVSKCWSAEMFLSVELTVLNFVSKYLSEILETKTVSKCMSITIFVSINIYKHM